MAASKRPLFVIPGYFVRLDKYAQAYRVSIGFITYTSEGTDGKPWYSITGYIQRLNGVRTSHTKGGPKEKKGQESVSPCLLLDGLLLKKSHSVAKYLCIKLGVRLLLAKLQEGSLTMTNPDLTVPFIASLFPTR